MSVVRCSDGAELAYAVVEYSRWKEGLYCDPAASQYRQHPLDYIESLEKCVNDALDKCGAGVRESVVGFSFDTTAFTPAIVDETGVPLATKTGNAEKIWVSLSPGIPTVTDVLDVLQSIINVEAAAVMQPSEGPEPEIFKEFEEMLPEMELLGRYEFYSECTEKPLSLVIATGEKRTFANLLLTVGCA